MQILEKTNLNALNTARNIGPLGVIEALENKELVGRGGGAFPVGKKWKFAIDTPSDRKYVICNADEGEPGTFKDKFILEKNPDTIIEGIITTFDTFGALFL